MSDETPQAWVGCLACYNEGRLTGQWVEGSEAGDFVPCQRPTHEEWWVFDHQGYDGLLDEECSPMEAQRKAELIERINGLNHPVAAVTAWAKNNLSHGVDDLDENFEDSFLDAYQGEWESEKDFAQDWAEQTGAIDENARWPQSCIDWDWATRELFDDLWTADAPGGIYVFRNS